MFPEGARHLILGTTALDHMGPVAALAVTLIKEKCTMFEGWVSNKDLNSTDLAYWFLGARLTSCAGLKVARLCCALVKRRDALQSSEQGTSRSTGR